MKLKFHIRVGEETNIAQCHQMIMRGKLNIDFILSKYRVQNGEL